MFCRRLLSGRPAVQSIGSFTLQWGTRSWMLFLALAVGLSVLTSRGETALGAELWVGSATGDITPASPDRQLYRADDG